MLKKSLVWSSWWVDSGAGRNQCEKDSFNDHPEYHNKGIYRCRSDKDELRLTTKRRGNDKFTDGSCKDVGWIQLQTSKDMRTKMYISTQGRKSRRQSGKLVTAGDNQESRNWQRRSKLVLLYTSCIAFEWLHVLLRCHSDVTAISPSLYQSSP